MSEWLVRVSVVDASYLDMHIYISYILIYTYIRTHTHTHIYTHMDIYIYTHGYIYIDLVVAKFVQKEIKKYPNTSESNGV